jgi:hypothetical protein
MSRPTQPQTPKGSRAIKRAMNGKGWQTLWVIGSRVFSSSRMLMEPQTVSARVRDLRKEQYGGHDVQRRYAGNGIYEYKLFRK